MSSATVPDGTPSAARPSTLPSVAIVGLGEVGRIYGAALVERGHRVTGFDPFVTEPIAGVEVRPSLAEAVADVEVVLVLTAASVSLRVAADAAPYLAPAATYVDCTSSAPGTKQELVGVFAERSDVRVVDVAILGPVIQLGVRTPLMAAGEGGAVVATVMAPLGASVEVVEDGRPGDAMAHKLLRSVFMKGLASVVVEAVTAGRAAGREEWIRGQIANMIAGDGQAVIDRFLTGTVKHAARRSVEMRATAEYLAALTAPHEMTDASATAMERIVAEGAEADQQ